MPSVRRVLDLLNDLDARLNALPPDAGQEAITLVLQAAREVVPEAQTGLEAGPDTIAFPLLAGHQELGALHVATDRPLSPTSRGLLEQLAHRAASSLLVDRQVRAIQQALARKEDELARLHRAALLISSRSNLQTTLDTILQMALDVTGARYGIVRLRSPEGTLITGSVAGENLQRPVVEALSLTPETITGWVASHAQPLRIADVREPPWNSLYYPLDRDREMRSELAVPLVGGGGQVEGVLNLESPRVGAFGEDDRLLLQALATQAVIAIQEARLLDALQDSAEHLLSWPCHRVLDRLVDLARDLVGAKAACIRTADTERGATPDLEVPIGRDRPLGAIEVYGLARADAEWDRKVLGCLAHMAALAMDNEDRQRLLQHTLEQRTVAETFAAVGDVAANLLHQLNNKLGIIPLRVQGVEDRCSDVLAGNPWLSRQLGEIRKSAQEAMAAVRDNLSLLRPGQNAPVGLRDCIEQALRMLSTPPGFTVELSDLQALPPISADPRSLAMVFVNLFDNASVATGGSGEVIVRGHFSNGAIAVDVSDSGPGIPRELQDRIFEHSWSGRSGKLGFGLWWVRTLMTRLGGAITVESDGQHGTTFHLSFPAGTPAAAGLAGPDG